MKWQHAIQKHSRADIDAAIKNDTWQQFRKNLKSMPTEMKLSFLDKYLRNALGDESLAEMGDRMRQVQVDNYINALKRGGQLDLEGNVVR